MNKTIIKLVAAAGLAWGLALPLLLGSDVDEGMAAFKRGDYLDAYDTWLPLAKDGAAMDQRKVAMLFYLGLGVEQDYGKAAQWYRKSALQGDVEAQYQIGYIYDKGLGLDEDNETAAKWYLKAAEQNEAIAQYKLGVLYLDGIDMPQDFARAYNWLERAAAQFEKLSVSDEKFKTLRDQAVRARDEAKAKMPANAQKTI